MIRIQISLDEHDYALAKSEAEALGISLAELVRRALRRSLPARGDTPWMRYVGMVESGDPNSSRKVDEIVYGIRD
jgi:hypothetical protein